MFIEFGNGVILKGLNKKITETPTFNISHMETLKDTLEKLQ